MEEEDIFRFEERQIRNSLHHQTVYAPADVTRVCIPARAISFSAVVTLSDHWNPSKRRYRIETFCYGPRSCSLYRSGPARKVPGRHGMSYTEEDWVDDEATSLRGPDE
jgi:hypothetical protein